MRNTIRLARQFVFWVAFFSAPLVNAQSVLYFQSKPEHGIAQGQTRNIREVDGYSVQVLDSGSVFRATFNATTPSPPNGSVWELTISAPAGQMLAIGTFDALDGKIDFTGPYSCYGQGKFQVFDIVRNANGKITSIAVDFEHRCYSLTNPPLFGQLRYNSTLPIDTALKHIDEFAFAPILTAMPNSTQITPAVSISGINVSLPVSTAGGEYSKNNAPFTRTPGSVVAGDSLRVSATAPAQTNKLAVATLSVGSFVTPFSVATGPVILPQPNGDPLVYLAAQSSQIGVPNITAVYTPATLATFNLRNSVADNGQTISATAPGAGWYALIKGPDYAPLAAGTYDNVLPFPDATRPGLYTSGSLSCSSSGATKMVIHEVAYTLTGAIDKLALAYVLECPKGLTPYTRIFGHIRIKSTLPIDYTLNRPVPFVFPHVSDAALSAPVVSAPAIVSGINIPISVSISGGEYSLDNGQFTNAPSSAVNGQSIRVRVQSAATANAVTEAVLTVGEVVAAFRVGTATGNAPQPSGESLAVLVSHPLSGGGLVEQVTFSPATGKVFGLSSQGYSTGQVTRLNVGDYGSNNYPTWTALFGGVNISPLSIGSYLVNNYPDSMQGLVEISGFPSCGGGLSGGRMNVLEAEYLSDGTPSKLAVDFVIFCPEYVGKFALYGYVRANSVVPIDYTIRLPVPFSFKTVGNQVPGALVESDEVTVRGTTVPVAIAISSGEYSLDGAAYTALPGIVVPNQRLRLRVAASLIPNATVTSSVTVGERTTTFTVGTTPDAIPQPTGEPLIVLFSQDPATGLTAQKILSPATNAFVSTLPDPSDPGKFVVVADESGYTFRWYAAVEGGNSQALVPGTYVNTTEDGRDGSPVLNISASNNFECRVFYQTDQDGRFVVHEIEYPTASSPGKIAFDYVTRCKEPSFSQSAVFGFVRINSRVPIDYTIRLPIHFSFPMVTNAIPLALVESREVTVQGINVPVPVTVTAGEYSIDGGAYTSTPGQISAGQKLKLRLHASANENAVTTMMVNVGEGSAEFRVGTRTGINPPPNGASLVVLISQRFEQSGQGRTWYLSPANQSRFNLTRNAANGANLVVQTPSAQYPGSDFTWYLNFVGPGQSQLQPGYYYNAQSPYQTDPNRPTISVSGYNCSTTAGEFAVYESVYSATGITALAIDFVHYCTGSTDPLYGYIRINSSVPIVQIADRMPSFYYFNSLTGTVRNTTFMSNTVQLNDFNMIAPITITGGEYSIDGSPFTSAPGTVVPGQSVRVRTLSSANFGTTSTAMLNVGGITGPFSVQTESLDVIPDNFGFTHVTGAALGQWISSNVVTVSGINSPAAIAINGGEFSIGGRAFSSAPSSINPGETLQVRVVSSTVYGVYRSSTVTIGGYTTGYFSVRALAPGLSVLIVGAGSVSSTPNGISCPTACASVFAAGADVTLTASPAAGARFTGWSGAGCSGVATCRVTSGADQVVTASFATAVSIATVIPGDGQATFSLVTTPSAGDPAATGYTVTCGNVTKTGPGSPITLTGLTNGVTYTCAAVVNSAAGSSTPSASVSVTPSASAPLALTNVQSRKMHGTAGTFDLPITYTEPLNGAITIEPRIVGTGHKIVFQFNQPITSAERVIVSPVGIGTTTVSGSEVIVTLTGIPDNSRTTVTLIHVNTPGTGGSASVGFLVGDINSSRSVNSSDISGLKFRSGQTVNASNFKFDVNTSGSINSSDISAVKSRSGLVLSP